MSLIRRDLEAHAKTLTALVDDQKQLRAMIDQIQIDRAVRKERDKALYDRLERIEGSIGGLHSLGKWILTAFASLVIAAFVQFIIRGGLHVPL